MLEKYDAKATFFVLGKNVEAYPDLFRRIVDAGHKVGNHTYSHQKGWGMSLERYIEDVDFANDLIHSELFRPPYADHAGAGPGVVAALQAGDVGRAFARLQPVALAPQMPEERNQTPRTGSYRGFPRQRKIVPEHALCLAPHVGQDPEVGAQMQNHRIVTL